MSVIGIVCEFNPFHNGHKYLIDSVKNQGDIVVCVMSGNFVQRAEPSIFPKETRVKAALLNGADIVLELPFVYATASAEIFAYNAVRILDSFGCDKLAFGTENATVEQLNTIVDVLNEDYFDEKIKDYLQSGESYPSARQSALNSYGKKFDVNSPNNILAIEYIKAIISSGSNLKIHTVKRVNNNYSDEDMSSGTIQSATAIRKSIEQKDISALEFTPNITKNIILDAISSGDFPCDNERISPAVISSLRLNSPANFESIHDTSGGLYNRLARLSLKTDSITSLTALAQTKKYTTARIRRATAQPRLAEQQRPAVRKRKSPVNWRGRIFRRRQQDLCSLTQM